MSHESRAHTPPSPQDGDTSPASLSFAGEENRKGSANKCPAHGTKKPRRDRRSFLSSIALVL